MNAPNENQTELCLNHPPPNELSAFDDKVTASEVSLTAPVAAEDTKVMGDITTVRSETWKGSKPGTALPCSSAANRIPARRC